MKEAIKGALAFIALTAMGLVFVWHIAEAVPDPAQAEIDAKRVEHAKK